MREETLRSVLLVKAIEDVDRAGTIIPPGDREQATREALRSVGIAPDPAADGKDDARVGDVLGDRAARLTGPLEERFPIVAEVLGRTRTPAWTLVGVLLLAFASGIGLSALDGSRRINILAFPFIGLIAWNLAAYGLLAITWIRRRYAPDQHARRGEHWAARAFARRVAPLLKHTTQVHAVLGQAIGGYSASWIRVGSPFIGQHARRWLHLAAAAVALGLIVGLYVRGTLLRYDAGWESTFLGTAQVRSLLGLLFGPVAGWSGVALPQSIEEVEALRWTTTGGGGHAAPWIHLIALSLGCFVLLPRLLLAATATLGLARLDRAKSLPEELRAYAAALLRGGPARPGGVISVTPYAYEPSDTTLASLERWLETEAGGDVRVDRRATLRYGDEEGASSAFDAGANRVADQHVLLMSLAATPETENHGVVITAARDSARRARPPGALRVVVDAAPYAARFEVDPSLASRLGERQRLWHRFVAGYGLDAEIVDLRNGDDRLAREGAGT
jgi:hypothetical protein